MTTSDVLWIIVTSNLASVLIGWLLGRTARNTARLVAEVEAVADEPGVSEETSNKLHRITKGVRPMHLAMVLLVVVGAVTALVGFIGLSQSSEAQARAKAAQERADRAIVCVTDYSNRNADALLTRADASAKAQAELDRVWVVIAGAFAQPDPKAGDRVRAAIDGYNKARAAARDELAKHPFPDPPRDVCSELPE